MTHCTQLALVVLLCGDARTAANSELAKSIIEDAPATACGLTRNDEWAIAVFADSIQHEMPGCAGCLKECQRALVMRDEHLMQWGEG